MAELIVKNVTLSYEQKPVIEDISIELHGNELVCLLGASGGFPACVFRIREALY